MTTCKYCKMGIDWKQEERKYPKKVLTEINGKPAYTYMQTIWMPLNPDGTNHRCRR